MIFIQLKFYLTRRVTLAIYFLLLLLNQSSLAATQSKVLPFFRSYQVNRYTFDNGLRLLVVEDHSSPTFAYQTWYQVGSRNEVPSRTGLAHFFEHMMFKGTNQIKEGEFDRLLEGAGAEGENAFTSRDFTAYIQELPKDQLALIARLEADRMTHLEINQASYQTEREVVQNERRYRNENSPEGLMDQELFELGFQKHPYHWPVIGYQKDLEEMTPEDAIQFYRNYYSPNHATIIVVGDVVPSQVATTVNQYYGQLLKQESPQHRIESEPAQKSPRRKELKLNIQVEKIMIGFPIPNVLHKDIPALDLLSTVLTGGKSSRLNRALVETGVATGVDTDENESKDPTLFVIAANLQQNKKASQAEKIILDELNRLKKTPILPAELERAKNKAEFGFYEGLESNYEKAQFLGQMETIAGDFSEGIRLHTEVQKITAADIQRVAKKYFDPNARTVITGVKK